MLVLVGLVAAGISASVLAAQTPPSAPTNIRMLATPRPHLYFESLVDLPTHFRSWSLRDQQQLDGLTGLGKSMYFRYVFGYDAYSNPQDGAKFYKPADDQVGSSSDSIPGNQQLKMPIGISGTDTILITWDFWYGAEFRNNRGNDYGGTDDSIANYKTFQLRQGDVRWWSMVNAFKTAAAGDSVWGPSPAPAVARLNNSIDGMDPMPAGMTDFKPITPSGVGAVGEGFLTNYGVWTRYWIEVRLNRPAEEFTDWKSIDANTVRLTGTWHMVSMWIADESRGPTRILYKVPATWTAANHGDTIGRFDFEFNTSTKADMGPVATGPLIGYGRNVVVLRNHLLPRVPESDSRIFVRPVP